MNTTNENASVFDLLIRDESPSGECKLCERHADTINELREALELVLPKVAHDYKCGKVRPAMHWAEHGSMSFDDCQCEIKAASAILEKTK